MFSKTDLRELTNHNPYIDSYISYKSIKKMDKKELTNHNPYIESYFNYKPIKKMDKNVTKTLTPKFFNNILEDKVTDVALNIFQKIIHFFAKLLWNDYKTHFNNRVVQFKAKQDEKSYQEREKSKLDLIVPIFLNKLHNDNNKSVPLFSLPQEILAQCLLKLPSQDIRAFFQTCTKAKASISHPSLAIVLEKIKWEKTTGLPFDLTIPPIEQKKMHKEVGIDYPPLVKSLGGLKAVYELPVLALPDDQDILTLKLANIKTPVMRGKWKKRPFIVFCLFDLNERKPYLVVFLRNEENCYPDWWHCFNSDYRGGSQPDICLGESLVGNTTCYKKFNQIREKIILDRVRRLVNYEPIGWISLFPICLNEPFSKSRAPYLDDPGRGYMSRYETKLKKPNYTYITLWDPSKQREENVAKIIKRFPGIS